MISLMILLFLSVIENNESHTISIPRLGMFGSPEEACSTRWNPRAENLFTRPWCTMGRDWIIRPGIARAWSVRNGKCIMILSEEVSNYMTLSGGFSDTSVTALSPHLVSIDLTNGWSKILTAPVEPTVGSMPVGFGPYEVLQWVPEQHVVLTKRRGVRKGPDTVVLTACASREQMIRKFLSGEFDLLDDISFDERAIICREENRRECFARRSNSLVYLMWNTTCLDVHDPSVRSFMSRMLDKRRLASRVGSRPSWVTSCPLPPVVPGSWNSSLSRRALMDSSASDIQLPKDITVLTEPRWETVQAGKEVSSDFERMGIHVRLVTSDQWLNDPTYIHETAALIGVWEVRPDAVLPPSPHGWDDPLAMSRAACEISTVPTDETWYALAERLKSALARDTGIVSLCWLARWATVNSQWILSDPGPGPLDGQIGGWTFDDRPE